MIHIVDYGLGNVQAFVTLYKRLGIETVRARTDAELAGARKIILPGVGASDHAMELLGRSGMRPILDKLVREDKIPVLGICVGMQILASCSDEGRLPCLGFIPARVRAFRSNELSSVIPLPHMGWNDVLPANDCALFKGFDLDARFYFLHSYYFECNDSSHVAATAHYGIDFACAVRFGNVFGVQFHPEKSHHYGAALLKNFAEI